MTNDPCGERLAGVLAQMQGVGLCDGDIWSVIESARNALVGP